MSMRIATKRLLAPARSAAVPPSTSSLLRTTAIAQPLRLASTSSLIIPTHTAKPLVLTSLRSFHTTPIKYTTSSSTSSSKTSENNQHQQQQQQQQQQQHTESDSESTQDSDAPPPKASLRERLKFLTRRYGWWALGVYLAASTVDFSLIFLAIHLVGADHIRSLEAQLRKSIGLEARHDEPAKEEESRSHTKKSAVGGGSSSSTIWTEAVLAYTIHKTLLLPVRVAFTAAVTPSFVKWLVKMGWAKANHQVKANMGRKAADKAIVEVAKRNTPKMVRDTNKYT